MTPLPHSAPVEQHVLAVCLMDEGVTLARARESGITDQSFYLPENRTIWRAFDRLPKPDTIILPAELGEDGIKAIGGIQYLFQITDNIPTTLHAGAMIAKLRELEQKRHLIRQATDLIEHAQNGSSLPELAEMAASLQPTEPRSTNKKLDLLSRRVRASAAPVEPTVRLYLADKPICTPGNITTLTSKAKTGKTAALGAATAAIISASSGTTALSDTFKFRAANPAGHAVIVFDTEQSPYDAYQCYKRSLARAGITEDPTWLHHYSLVGMSARQLHEALDLALQIAAETHGQIFAIILDGVADFVNSVNDEAESNQFVTWLRDRTVTNNCPAICVIHSNEGEKAGNDSRGHLGKQLIRKAESNLLLKKTGEVTTITSDKQRKAPITEADGVAFQWSEPEQRHVSCGVSSVTGKAAGRPPRYDQAKMLSCVPGPSEPPRTVANIHRLVGELPCTISIKAFKEWMEKWISTGEVIRHGDVKTGFSFTRSV